MHRHEKTNARLSQAFSFRPKPLRWGLVNVLLVLNPELDYMIESIFVIEKGPILGDDSAAVMRKVRVCKSCVMSLNGKRLHRRGISPGKTI